jgi:hypothetical protein
VDTVTEHEMIWRLAKSHMAATTFMEPGLFQAVVDYMGAAALSVPDWETAEGLMNAYWVGRGGHHDRT